jgi:hypothetical protein
VTASAYAVAAEEQDERYEYRNDKVVVNGAMSLDGFIAAPGHTMVWGARIGCQVSDPELRIAAAWPRRI